jgi:hypothetical protein
MRKYNLLIACAISTIFILQVAACKSNNNNNETTVDSTHAGNVVDSMPVVNTPVTDSSAIITTPPVNDNNVVNPDTTKK